MKILAILTGYQRLKTTTLCWSMRIRASIILHALLYLLTQGFARSNTIGPSFYLFSSSFWLFPQKPLSIFKNVLLLFCSTTFDDNRKILMETHKLYIHENYIRLKTMLNYQTWVCLLKVHFPQLYFVWVLLRPYTNT